MPVVVFFLHRRANNVASLRMCACVCVVCIACGTSTLATLCYFTLFLCLVLAYFLAEFSLLFLVLAMKLYYLLSAYAFSLFFIEFKDSATFHTHTRADTHANLRSTRDKILPAVVATVELSFFNVFAF